MSMPITHMSLLLHVRPVLQVLFGKHFPLSSPFCDPPAQAARAATTNSAPSFMKRTLDSFAPSRDGNLAKSLQRCTSSGKPSIYGRRAAMFRPARPVLTHTRSAAVSPELEDSGSAAHGGSTAVGFVPPVGSYL